MYMPKFGQFKMPGLTRAIILQESHPVHVRPALKKLVGESLQAIHVLAYTSPRALLISRYAS